MFVSCFVSDSYVSFLIDGVGLWSLVIELYFRIFRNENVVLQNLVD